MSPANSMQRHTHDISCHTHTTQAVGSWHNASVKLISQLLMSDRSTDRWDSEQLHFSWCRVGSDHVFSLCLWTYTLPFEMMLTVTAPCTSMRHFHLHGSHAEQPVGGSSESRDMEAVIMWSSWIHYMTSSPCVPCSCCTWKTGYGFGKPLQTDRRLLSVYIVLSSITEPVCSSKHLLVLCSLV